MTHDHSPLDAPPPPVRANGAPANQPSLVTDAIRLTRLGVDRVQVAAELVTTAGGDRDALADAVTFWLRRMAALPSDDYEGTSILRSLEEALRAVPRSKPAS